MRPSARSSLAVASQSDYSLSHHLAMQVYWPFFQDFGPLNLGLAFRFCRKTAQLLQVSSRLCISVRSDLNTHGQTIVLDAGVWPQSSNVSASKICM